MNFLTAPPHQPPKTMSSRPQPMGPQNDQDLNSEVPGGSLAVHRLPYDRFTQFLRDSRGFVDATNYIFLEVPDECGGNPESQDIYDGRSWRGALQSCHNAGLKECTFTILSQKDMSGEAMTRSARDVKDQELAWATVLFVMSLAVVVWGLLYEWSDGGMFA
ncbi:hypothetical protein EK21DRAFT_84559 [Setomelanomma holmii]|uniref:Uncharacterized protein n=1 Tax=Setomelanomma holmii TaxID=210430 RepID=A0A9P4LU92_9PLEO|nr:hypothetical protein EK21DRAFT_84559 [Setomelanomma holmii]